MIRSIDFLFSTPEFLNILREMSPRQTAPFYHLLHLSESQIYIPANIIRRISENISQYTHDAIKVEYGKILFLSFLDGSGFIAEKLLSEVDENFLVNFILGSITTENEERDVWLPNSSERFHHFIDKHFYNIANLLMEPTGHDVTVAKNHLIILALTDPNRLLDLHLFEKFAGSKGIEKSFATENFIQCYKELKYFDKITKDQSEKQIRKMRPTLSNGNGLIFGMRTLLKLETLNGNFLNVPINFSFFLDFLYDNLTLPSKEECFLSWTRENNIDPLDILSLGEYPEELNLKYQRPKAEDNSYIAANFISFLIYRFGSFYDIAEQMMRLLRYSTDFDTKKFPPLEELRNRSILVASPEELEILPIVEAISDNYQGKSELRFRKPIVSLSSRISSSEGREMNQEFCLKKVDGITPEIREFIQGIFFGMVKIKFTGLYAREVPVYYLRTKQEMKAKLENIDIANKYIPDTVNFREYLISMGFGNESLLPEEYLGLKGMMKAIEIHSIEHWRLGDKNSYKYPIYYNSLLMNSD